MAHFEKPCSVLKLPGHKDIQRPMSSKRAAGGSSGHILKLKLDILEVQIKEKKFE